MTGSVWKVLQIGLRQADHGRLAVSDVATPIRSPAMTKTESKLAVAAAQELMKGNPAGLFNAT